jgi:triacylglycerol esterase/lipase EstA (alpha/beta hydrolase family)
MPLSGLDGVAANAAYLRQYVAWVLKVTGAKKVDFVTHSQGGLSALAFIRAGGEQVVDSVTALAAPFHGVAGPWQPILDIFKGVGFLRWLAPKGLLELDARSDTIKELMSGDPTPGDIKYTSIYAQDADFIVIPGSSPHLEGAENIVLSTKGWLGNRGRDHLSVNHADEVYTLVRRALINSRHG